MADDTPKMNSAPSAAAAPRPAVAVTQAVVGKFKSFGLLTQAGAICAAVFIILQFIPTLNVRWWLMLPLAVAGAGLLIRPLTGAAGTERLVAIIAFYALLAFFLWRDAQLSSDLSNVRAAFEQWKTMNLPPLK